MFKGCDVFNKCCVTGVKQGNHLSVVFIAHSYGMAGTVSSRVVSLYIDGHYALMDIIHWWTHSCRVCGGGDMWICWRSSLRQQMPWCHGHVVRITDPLCGNPHITCGFQPPKASNGFFVICLDTNLNQQSNSWWKGRFAANRLGPFTNME